MTQAFEYALTILRPQATQVDKPLGSGWSLHSFQLVSSGISVCMWQRSVRTARAAVQLDDLDKVYVQLCQLHADEGGGIPSKLADLAQLVLTMRNDAEDIP